MDRTNAQYGRSDLQYPTQTPPWRAAQLPHRGISGRVDSWRSYKADATNLQTQTGSTLNATAQPFEPPPKAQQYFKPHEPLRVSNGTRERNVMESNNVSKNEKKKKNKRRAGIDPPLPTPLPAQAAQPVEPSAAFASRYPVRSNRGLADQPIPSIEVPVPVNTPAPRIVYQKSGADRRSRTQSPPAPGTTAAYRSEAQKEPVKLSEPQRLLVVLDLNGTLLYRSRSGSRGQVHMRPGVTPLLDYLFKNHVVMVYTSAMPESATHMVNQFLHPKYRNQLAAIWARDKLDLTKEQYASRVQVYKNLDKVWKDESIQKAAGAGNRWDQSNTVLVDDSKLKAVAQPHNLVQVTEYTAKDDPVKAKGKNKHDQAHQIQRYIMQQLEMKFEELKHQENVSRLIRKWQLGEIAVPKLPGQEIVVEETVDQKTMRDQEESTKATKQAQPLPHLLTPDSIGEISTREGDSVEMPQQISDDEDEESGAPLSPTRSTVSPIDEGVFRELLEGTGK